MVHTTQVQYAPGRRARGRARARNAFTGAEDRAPRGDGTLPALTEVCSRRGLL